jgi:ABC-type nickel/cobalt efflux system permease component RcnA
MKFIIAVLILVGAEQIMSNTSGYVADAAAFLILFCAVYLIYKVYTFMFGNKTKSDAQPSITKTSEFKYERRPVIHAEGSTQIVRQERVGFEKWKVVMGSFGKNGQRNEIGSTTITPSMQVFSSGKDSFAVTWA